MNRMRRAEQRMLGSAYRTAGDQADLTLPGASESHQVTVIISHGVNVLDEMKEVVYPADTLSVRFSESEKGLPPGSKIQVPGGRRYTTGRIISRTPLEVTVEAV